MEQRGAGVFCKNEAIKMEKRLSLDYLVYPDIRNGKLKTLPLEMVYVLEGRYSWLYYLQLKMTLTLTRLRQHS